MSRENVQMKLYGQTFDLFALLMLFGAIAAMILDRASIYISGSTGIKLPWLTIYTFYFGAAMLAAGLFTYRFRWLSVPRSLQVVTFFSVGAGIGIIGDEFNLLLNLGRNYTVSVYNSPLNIYSDMGVVLILLILVIWADSR